MKILVTSTHSASFILDDIRLLSKHFAVRHVLTNSISSTWRIRQLIRDSDVTFTWFASAYSAAIVFWANRLGKKSVIAVGGVDLARIPDIGYGIWVSWWKSILVRYALKRASVILAVDPSLMLRAKELAKYNGANLAYLPTGYDPEFWRPGGDKERQVLCVAKCEDVTRAKVKGLPLLFDAARLLPEIPFVVVGVEQDIVAQLAMSVPNNVRIVPRVRREELLQYYQRSKVYCQPSLTEGLPNSVCEAMLCGCIPVGTDVGGMRSAVGDHGFLVSYGNAETLASAITKALHAPGQTGAAGREHIVASFHIASREAGLIRILNDNPQ